ncbi:hypothetical protein EWM64_g1449 [Hericium alpestre]|uniref:Uncharacterized protein n=1 Tax=Hericium alpestre TaxID=135208 RepID=A0A4Z0A6C5_9AGAM|nr:hypothetical protein EWM64_g1449 [Hericium alpestre]
MATATPTVLPRSQIFPRLLPKPPQPHPIPKAQPGRWTGRLNATRDIVQEMDDLSDEEAELEDITMEIKNRGYMFLVPIGKMFTQYEEKNDADEGSEGDDSHSSHQDSQGPGSDEDGGDESEEEGVDLDAEMEDMDDADGDPDEMDDADGFDDSEP